jgi:beta-xylosidase
MKAAFHTSAAYCAVNYVSLLLMLSSAQPLAASDPKSQPAHTAEAAPWQADLGDGRYKNPVLFADYSDPDAVRVGEEYWMTSSSFSHVPGLPILRSRDLVNWTLVNHALPRLHPQDHFSTPRHGAGVWAPAIRYHDGKFWIFYPDPDFGLYMINTTDPAGKWSEPQLVKSGRGLIDPCPLWDDDGQAYLVHAWAKSRSGINNRLTVHRMSPDGTRVLDEGTVVVDANTLAGWRTLEGPKFYKRNGEYWIFAPAGGVEHGYQAVFRSKSPLGPYKERIVLEQGTTPVNGPHQGAWIVTPGGQDWFLHFQDRGAYGRIVHLQPMTWREDGWPVMGSDPDGDGKGEPVLVHAKPDLPKQPITAPAASDVFADRLGLQWQWQANPKPHWAAVKSPGALTMSCVAAPSEQSLWLAPNLLMQKLPAPAFTASTIVTLSAKQPGDTAGLIVFGFNYAWIGLRHTREGVQLVHRVCLRANEGGQEVESTRLAATSERVHLRVRVRPDARAQFAYSFDGESFVDAGEPLPLMKSQWVGAKVGLFASSSPGVESGGEAVFHGFRLVP